MAAARRGSPPPSPTLATGGLGSGAQLQATRRAPLLLPRDQQAQLWRSSLPPSLPLRSSLALHPYSGASSSAATSPDALPTPGRALGATARPAKSVSGLIELRRRRIWPPLPLTMAAVEHGTPPLSSSLATGGLGSGALLQAARRAPLLPPPPSHPAGLALAWLPPSLPLRPSLPLHPCSHPPLCSPALVLLTSPPLALAPSLLQAARSGQRRGQPDQCAA